MGDGINRIARGLGKISAEARETLIGATDNVKEGVEKGLIQYNAKAQKFANKILGDWGQKTAK